MHIVDERRRIIAQEISLLRELGAGRRIKSVQLFLDRQNSHRSVAETIQAAVPRLSEKNAA